MILRKSVGLSLYSRAGYDQPTPEIHPIPGDTPHGPIPGNSSRHGNLLAAAWSSQPPEGVAAFYAPDGKIAINGGDELAGRAAIAEMAAGFYAEFPDLTVHLDDIRAAGNRVKFRAGRNGHCLTIAGWQRRLAGLMQPNMTVRWPRASDRQR